jgi:hypothetical protein
MNFFSKKLNLLTPYKFLLLFLQNQKNSKQKYKDYDINENSANKHKIKYINSGFAIILERHLPPFGHNQYKIKNKLAKRRVCGVERLVGFCRRGNLNVRQVFRAIFM